MFVCCEHCVCKTYSHKSKGHDKVLVESFSAHKKLSSKFILVQTVDCKTNELIAMVRGHHTISSNPQTVILLKNNEI